MLAFHNTPITKPALLKQLRAHAKADQIVKGQYWQDGKGCAVGCAIHGSDHALYESMFGIPQMLAYLEDAIFEGLPNDKARTWPIRFVEAIPLGADLSLVGWKFLYWLLTDQTVNPGITDPAVSAAVHGAATLIGKLARGEAISASAAWSARRSAAWSARSARGAARSARGAARSAARSAESAAESAAWSAESAERSAESAERSAESAERSAESAERSALSAAESALSAAWSAERIAWSAAYVLMSNKLLFLIKAAPKGKP